MAEQLTGQESMLVTVVDGRRYSVRLDCACRRPVINKRIRIKPTISGLTVWRVHPSGAECRENITKECAVVSMTESEPLTGTEEAAVEAAAQEIEALTDPEDRRGLREHLRRIALERRRKS